MGILSHKNMLTGHSWCTVSGFLWSGTHFRLQKLLEKVHNLKVDWFLLLKTVVKDIPFWHTQQSVWRFVDSFCVETSNVYCTYSCTLRKACSLCCCLNCLIDTLHCTGYSVNSIYVFFYLLIFCLAWCNGYSSFFQHMLNSLSLYHTALYRCH